LPDPSLACPRCSTPSNYIYDNTGSRGQYLCKICRLHFNHKNRFSKEAILKCPHCNKTMDKIKQRRNFTILFVAYFNLLRHHSALKDKVPAVIPELDNLPNMPAKWIKLIALAQEKQSQTAVVFIFPFQHFCKVLSTDLLIAENNFQGFFPRNSP